MDYKNLLIKLSLLDLIGTIQNKEITENFS